VVRYQKNFLRIKGPIKTQISAPIVVGSWCTSSTTLGMMLALHHPKVTPAWAMVTPERSLFNSSSLRMASWICLGMILVFLLSRAALPADNDEAATSSTRRCSMINRALLVLQLRCITSEVKLFLERRYIINKKMFHDQCIHCSWGV